MQSYLKNLHQHPYWLKEEQLFNYKVNLEMSFWINACYQMVYPWNLMPRIHYVEVSFYQGLVQNKWVSYLHSFGVDAQGEPSGPTLLTNTHKNQMVSKWYRGYRIDKAIKRIIRNYLNYFHKKNTNFFLKKKLDYFNKMYHFYSHFIFFFLHTKHTLNNGRGTIFSPREPKSYNTI